MYTICLNEAYTISDKSQTRVVTHIFVLEELCHAKEQIRAFMCAEMFSDRQEVDDLRQENAAFPR